MNIRQVLKNIRLKFNMVGSGRRKNKLNSIDFSIISNNCFAGIVYQHFNLQYNTPTVGLYFYPDEYIKFCKKFDYYIGQKLTFIKASNSKYFDDLKKNHYENVIVGMLDDVEIVFLHYKTEREAKDKWERGVHRLSKNIIFKFNDQNGATYENLRDFDALPYKNKIMFTARNYPEFTSNVFCKKYKSASFIKEDYYSVYKYINLVNYINHSIVGKKVLHIIPTYNYSGAENVAITIIDSLKKKYNFDYCSFNGNTKDILNEHKINFICINKFNPRSIKKIIREGKYDIIHAHDYKASCMCALVKGKTKLIMHLHNNSPWLKKVCFNSFAILFAAFRAEKILTVSESIEDEYIFSRFIDKKIECIDNPISRGKILPMVSKNDYQKKYDICCVARLTEQKNPMKFLDVLYSIKKSKSDVKAVWVGEGSLEVEVKKRIYELGLADNVEMVGFQKNPYKYMACSKIFMLTSDWEGYGLVAFEALTLGLPCIVSNVGGLPKIVDDSCGMLCNKAGDFVHEAIELLNDSNKYVSKSKNAVKKSKKIENIVTYINKIDDIYSNL